MQRIILFITTVIFIAACTSEKTSSTGNQFITAKVVDKLLSESLVYNSDSAYKKLEKVTKDQVTKSRQLFMQGLDMYINKRDAAAAAKIFFESVQYCPDAKTYNYLANCYVDLNDTTNADKAAAVMSEMSYDWFYTNARIAALKKDTAQAIESLGEAFQYGFTNKKRFENDKVFDYLRNERGFVALVVSYLKDDQKLRESLFKAFLASSPDLKLPFEFVKDSICETNLEKMYQKTAINYDFAPFVAGMEDSRFSRDVSNDYFMVGKMKLDNGGYAVFYKSVTVIADTLPPVEVKVAVFDSAGTFIEERTIAQYTLPETLVTGSIDENKILTVKAYKMLWKTDPMEDGFAGNTYMGEQFLSESKFIFGADGKLAIYNHKQDIAKQ